MAVHAKIEVAVEIPVALVRCVVVQASIELYHQPAVVLDIAVDHPGAEPIHHLSPRPRDTVTPLQGEVPVLQRGAGARGDIPEHGPHPRSPRHAASLAETFEQPFGCRAAALDRMRDLGQGCRVAPRRDDQASCHVDDGILIALPWRGGVPLHPVLEAVEPVDPETRTVLDPTTARDGEMDDVLGVATGPLDCAQRRHAVQGGGLVKEHAAPGPLEPGRRAGVLDEDAVMQAGQLPSTDETGDVVRCEAGAQELSPADHSGL